ncbi:MAG: gluconokinase [Sciscionella sp.]
MNGSRVIVVMGVSASGKSTVAELLAQRLDVESAEGDDLHPHSNVAKMTAGHPLTDVDRWPWLRRVGDWIVEHRDTGGVITCSALKRSYRDLLREYSERVWFLHLAGAKSVLAARIAARKGHFMPPGLLDSQYADLEQLGADEAGVTLDVEHTPEQLRRLALAALDE